MKTKNLIETILQIYENHSPEEPLSICHWEEKDWGSFGKIPTAIAKISVTIQEIQDMHIELIKIEKILEKIGEEL